jgi:hypothetical protein
MHLRGGIILKRILNKQVARVWTGFILLGTVTNGGSSCPLIGLRVQNSEHFVEKPSGSWPSKGVQPHRIGRLILLFIEKV